jgi:hypothetical protein
LIPDPQGARYLKIPKVIFEAVDRLIRDFVLPHALAFYTISSSDGDSFRRIASYILTSRKHRIVASDLTRNIAGMKGLSLWDVNQKVSPLIAGGWLAPEDAGPTNRAWIVKPIVFQELAEQARREEERKRDLAILMGSARKEKNQV